MDRSRLSSYIHRYVFEHSIGGSSAAQYEVSQRRCLISTTRLPHHLRQTQRFLWPPKCDISCACFLHIVVIGLWLRAADGAAVNALSDRVQECELLSTSSIIFRALQGIGGSGIYSMVMVTIPEITPPLHFGLVSGLISAVFASSSIIGPIMGGAITSHSSWRWVFWLK